MRDLRTFGTTMTITTCTKCSKIIFDVDYERFHVLGACLGQWTPMYGKLIRTGRLNYK